MNLTGVLYEPSRLYEFYTLIAILSGDGYLPLSEKYFPQASGKRILMNLLLKHKGFVDPDVLHQELEQTVADINSNKYVVLRDVALNTFRSLVDWLRETFEKTQLIPPPLLTIERWSTEVDTSTSDMIMLKVCHEIGSSGVAMLLALDLADRRQVFPNQSEQAHKLEKTTLLDGIEIGEIFGSNAYKLISGASNPTRLADLYRIDFFFERWLATDGRFVFAFEPGEEA